MNLEEYVTIQEPVSAIHWDEDHLVRVGQYIAQITGSWLNKDYEETVEEGVDQAVHHWIPLPDDKGIFRGARLIPGQFLVRWKGRWVPMGKSQFERTFEPNLSIRSAA